MLLNETDLMVYVNHFHLLLHLIFKLGIQPLSECINMKNKSPRLQSVQSDSKYRFSQLRQLSPNNISNNEKLVHLGHRPVADPETFDRYAMFFLVFRS